MSRLYDVEVEEEMIKKKEKVIEKNDEEEDKNHSMLKQENEQLENMAQSDRLNSIEELSAWEQFNAWEDLNAWKELNAWNIKGFHNMEAVEGFGLRLTRKDLYTLADSNWLNDEVINSYMNLLIARSTSSNKYPKVHAINTFFYPKLLIRESGLLKKENIEVHGAKLEFFLIDSYDIP
ncbi:sentrin-specific protease-like [Temnothorax americanus]|uniref:sentrin-specific protease-like n=1 Tax=Temnothorax americanus TaxID=1964332 RepID=UPI004068CF85